MKLIQTITLGSQASGITFTSIPQTFTDLVILSSCRVVAATFGADLGTTIGTMTFRELLGNGSSVGSQSVSGYIHVGVVPGSTATANTFGNSMAYIPNYTSSSSKSVSSEGVMENNATSSDLKLAASLGVTTSPITSLSIGSGTDMVAGSTISLYGITKGSDGIVTTS